MNAGHREVQSVFVGESQTDGGYRQVTFMPSSVVCYLRQHRALCGCRYARRSSSSRAGRRDEVCCALRHIPPPRRLKAAPRSIHRVAS